MDDESYGFIIYWRIENFNCEPSSNFRIESDIFEIESMEADWQLEMDVDNGFVRAFLRKITNSVPFPVYYSLCLLKRSQWITIIEVAKNRFKAGGTGYGKEMVNLKRLKKEKWKYAPGGSITISFRIWNNRIKHDSFQTVMVSRMENENSLCHQRIRTFSGLTPNDLLFFLTLPSKFHRYALTNINKQITKEVKTQQTQTDTSIDLKDADDLRKLFNEKEFSFVTLRTSTKEFSVHKTVLCAKSPVFNAMFERKMKENNCNVVDIDDIDSQTMSLLIKFLHFDPLGDLKWSDAVSLYYAADKYQIDSLRKECVSLLNKELSVQNICDALLLADLHQDSDLMNCALQYFCKNSKAILPSTQWKDILGHTELVASILCKLAETRL